MLIDHASIASTADQYRAEAYKAVGDNSRSQHGQFFTPPQVAGMMAALFDSLPNEINLLDAGAGVGVLIAAFIDELVTREEQPETVNVTAFEQELRFVPYLKETLEKCRIACERVGIAFSSVVKAEDFVDMASAMLRPRLLEGHGNVLIVRS